MVPAGCFGIGAGACSLHKCTPISPCTYTPSPCRVFWRQEWKEQSAKYPMDLRGMRQLYDIIDVIGLSG